MFAIMARGYKSKRILELFDNFSVRLLKVSIIRILYLFCSKFFDWNNRFHSFYALLLHTFLHIYFIPIIVSLNILRANEESREYALYDNYLRSTVKRIS